MPRDHSFAVFLCPTKFGELSLKFSMIAVVYEPLSSDLKTPVDDDGDLPYSLQSSEFFGSE